MNKNLQHNNIINREKIKDRFSRTISYLRLSLTDRCNLRCMYCMPPVEKAGNRHIKTAHILPAEEMLTYEELSRIVFMTVSLGMNKLRLTGGEPLVRKGVMSFIDQLSHIEGLEQIRLTTNGVLLHEMAPQLYDKGVHHLNISLDTLQPDKFKKITGKNLFEKVWRGITLAMDLGFKIKLNVVAMRGINDDEFLDFGKLALTLPLQVRFIEFMPIGENSTWEKTHYIEAEEIQTTLSKLGKLESQERSGAQGPARMYSLDSNRYGKGRIGFISPISHHFCEQCNRLRLTAEGKLRSCLLHDRETDIKELLRRNCSDHELENAIRTAIKDKPQGHALGTSPAKNISCQGQMSRIGG